MNHSLWRLVFDSNILLSSLLNSKGALRSVIELALSERSTILYSDEVLLEWHEVLNRPKFSKYFPTSTAFELLARLTQKGTRILITESIAACRDPNDDKFLELASNGNANVISLGMLTC